MTGSNPWLVCAVLGFALAATAGQSCENTRGTPFIGGTFEASGVAALPGGTAVLIVADNHPGQVIWMPITPEGIQADRVRTVSIGTEVEDPEDITTDGSWFYVVGSQSKGSDGAGLVRFRVDAAERRVSTVEAVHGLAEYLEESVPELRDAPELNVEGLAWDPARSALLLGLRAPLLSGNALIVPVKLKDPGAALSRDNLVPAGDVLQLKLDGDAVRGLEHDRVSGRFHVIAGPSGDERRDFRLLEWSGRSGDDAREVARFDGDLKPEGVARAGDLILLVCDTSRFIVLR